MNMRKITSMTLLTSLVVLVVNSVVLYIVPEGRIAHWANWIFLGLTKEEWADQHLTVGALFLIALILHIYYNWSLIVSYMKNKAKELKVFTPPFAIGLLVTLAVTVGTYFHLPPMSTLVEFGNSIKEDSAKTYGTPPYGRAELSSLKEFVQKERLDQDKSIELLKAAGVQVENSDKSLKSIAAENKLSPQQVYEIIKPAKILQPGPAGGTPSSGGPALLPDPQPGFGRKTLAEACTELGLEPDAIVTGLKEMGIDAKPGMTMKEIAEGCGREPREIYEVIRTLTERK
ncbi:MAG TPA: hypothetical protein DDY32_05390 [Desulfobulbaceae bacterium]|nr:hypothetical protein [Desulfobulbaceae bacterium]